MARNDGDNMTGPNLSSLLLDEWDATARATSDQGASDRLRLVRRVRSRRRRAHATRAAAVTAASGALILGGLGVAQAVANRGGAVGPASPTSTDPTEPSATTLLLLRVDLLPDDPDAAPSGNLATTPRLDSTALVHISADGSLVETASLSGFALTDAAACPLSDGSTVPAAAETVRQHVNLAMERGTFADGVACAEATSTAATGIDFDGVIVTDFSGFVATADALGGAVVCIPEAIVSANSQLALEPGTQRLNGIELLSLSRARNGTGLGGGDDESRTDRESRVMAALATSARDALNAGGVEAEALIDGSYVTGGPADPAWVAATAEKLATVPHGAIVALAVPLEIPAVGDAYFGAAAHQMFTDIANDVPVDAAVVAACAS